MTPGDVIVRYFAAMRQGQNSETDLLSLFAEDAVYCEPFIAPETPAIGRDAIRLRLQQGWRQPLPDMELDVLGITVDGSEATSRWECRSSAFTKPARGTDRYWFDDGLITRLEVTLDESGEPSPGGTVQEG